MWVRKVSVYRGRRGTPGALVLSLAMLWSLASPLVAQVEVTTLATDLDGRVGGVAVDALGFVYVADFGEKVWKITPYGDVEVFAETLYGASGNTVDGEGNLLQASFNAGTVSRIARSGQVDTLAKGLQGPVGIALDADGNAIVCECRANRLSKITPAGEVSLLASSPLLNCPNGITRTNAGDFYVVNFSDAKMLKVTAAGDVSEFATIPGGGNGHVVATPSGFFVTGFRSNQLYQVDPAGTVTVLAGTGSFDEKDGPAAQAAFSSPNGIAYDPIRRTLYVNDFPIPFLDRQRVRARSTLRAIQLPSLTQAFNKAYQDGGIEAAMEAYREFRKANPNQYTEIEVNVLGYRKMQSGNVEDAIALFEANAEAYPKSFNVWDSLAEGYKSAGKKEIAIRHYRKSLELNPANANAVTMLQELGVEP